MELIDRYLHAVRSYLGAEGQNDIVAELKDSLLSRMEEREAALGRRLSDAEQSALLKDVGHPLVVASRYLPQQYLISPTFFPYWWLAVRAMLIMVAIVHSVLAVIALTQSPYSVRTLLQSAYAAGSSALFWGAVITALFWLFERHQLRFGLLNNWQPDKLAKASEQNFIARSSSLFELIFNGVFLLWWTGWQPLPQTMNYQGEELRFGLTAVWQLYFWPILFLLSADMLLSACNLWHPYWTRARLWSRLILCVGGVMVIALLIQQPAPLLQLLDDAGAAQWMRLQSSLNLSLRIMLGIIAIVNVYDMFDSVRRLLNMKSR